jgi:hypothetical protein
MLRLRYLRARLAVRCLFAACARMGNVTLGPALQGRIVRFKWVLGARIRMDELVKLTGRTVTAHTSHR